MTTGLWDEATAAAVFDDEADLWQFDPDDVHMVCSPMYHTVSIRFAAGTLLRGGSLAILGRFEAATALGVLRQLRPTTTFLVPTHLHRLLGLAQPRRRRAVRLTSPAGPRRVGLPAGPEAGRHGPRRADGALWEFYGSTEGQFTACSPEEWLERPGTVGRARPGRQLSIDLADTLHGTVRPTGIGTIWCRTPPFARFAYWRQRGGHGGRLAGRRLHGG